MRCQSNVRNGKLGIDMPRGRPPISTELHLARGTFRADRHGRRPDAPKPPPDDQLTDDQRALLRLVPHELGAAERQIYVEHASLGWWLLDRSRGARRFCGRVGDLLDGRPGARCVHEESGLRQATIGSGAGGQGLLPDRRSGREAGARVLRPARFQPAGSAAARHPNRGPAAAT